MRDSFAVFILTHGRANDMWTLNALKRCGYTGKWYMILDDEDEQADLYKEKYGEEHIIIFNKQSVVDRTDTMDNFKEHRAIIYARNESWNIAKSLGLEYFLMLDDDYARIDYRYPQGKKLKARMVTGIDDVFEEMLVFLDASGADTVAFAQGGDFMCGWQGGRYGQGLLRKAMNSFFCRTDRPIEFRGTMNEDVVTYTTLSSRGRLLFTVCPICIIPKATQSLSGGMTEAYKDGGTYLKSFYAVMSMPSSVIVSQMGLHTRMHHRIDWDRTAPKILNERYKKGATADGSQHNRE